LVKKRDNFNHQQITRKWYTLSVQKKSQSSKEFNNVMQFIKNNFILFSAFLTLIYTVYYAYIYHGLLELGIPYDLIDKENIYNILFSFFVTVVSVYFFFFFSLNLILPIIFLIYFLGIKETTIFFIMFIAIVFMYQLVKKYLSKTRIYPYFYKYIDSKIDIILFKTIPYKSIDYINVSIGVMPSILFILSIVLLFLFPAAYFIQTPIGTKINFSEPSIFYKMYKSQFGLPKSVSFDLNGSSKIYILVAKDTNNYHGYLYDELIQFGESNNSIKYKEFCGSTNFKDNNDVVIELLRHSPYVDDRDNLEKFIDTLEYKKTTLDLEYLQNKCNQLKK
jgi:hypothetical protein